MAKRSYSITLLTLFLLTTCLMPGCQKKPARMGEVGGRQIDLQRIQSEHTAYCSRFMTAIADQYDRLSEEAPTEEGRTFALQRKVGNATALLAHTTLQNPMAGMIDSVVLISMLRRSAQDQWFQDIYGEKADPIVETLKRYEAEGWQRLQKYLTPEQVTELGAAIEAWREQHPVQRYVTATVDKDQFPDAIEISGGARGGGSVFGLLFLDPLAGLDPAMRQVELSRETAERVFFYFQRLPTLTAWQVELTYRRMLQNPQSRDVIESARKFTDATTRFAEVSAEFSRTSAEFSRTIAGFPAFVTAERDRTVQQLSSELDSHRRAATEELAKAVSIERDAMLKQTDALISHQRDAISEKFSETLSSKTDHAAEKMKLALNASIDHFFFRLVETLLVLAVLVAGLILLKQRRKPAN